MKKLIALLVTVEKGNIQNAAPQATVLGLAVQRKTAQESQDSTRIIIQDWISKSRIND